MHDIEASGLGAVNYFSFSKILMDYICTANRYAEDACDNRTTL